ncbi:MAG: hypothetical protein HKN43_16055 [Rhodothermales bacterium]|nr:hypothetical protein [Rhodothermales bacterium]
MLGRQIQKATIAVCAILILAGITGQDASAQSRWKQTVQIVTPIVSGELGQALVDSLIAVIHRNDIPVRRSYEDTTRYSAIDLEDILLDEGFDITSANQVFLTFLYEADPRTFSQEITEMYFIYRPQEYEESDIPIMLVDSSHPAVRNMLTSNGTRLESNEAVFEPFWDQLRLHQLEEGMVVQIGDRVIRDEQIAMAEKERIIGIIRRFLY